MNIHREYTIDTIDPVVQAIIPTIKNTNLFILIGGMGAGKTTLVRNIFEKMGIADIVTSPTFTYINRYYSPTYQKNVYHLDLYRLTSPDEFYALGLDEFIDDETAIVFIEWPEIIMEEIKKRRSVCQLKINFSKKNEETREIIITQK